MSDTNPNKLQIIFSDRTFTEEEINEVTTSFSKILPVEKNRLIRESTGDLPAVIILTLIGEGFFRAIGSDIYKKAKEKLINILKKKNSPSLQFNIKVKNTEITILTHDNEEQNWNKIFDTIASARALVVNEINKKGTPEMTEIKLGFDGNWNLLDGKNLNYTSIPKVLKFYKFNREIQKWELTQDLSNLINGYYQTKEDASKPKTNDAKA
jgi:hypothetical protein